MDSRLGTIKTLQSSRPPELVAAAWASGLRELWRRAQSEAARRPRATATLAALLIYLMISLVYFWWPVHGHFRDMAINAARESTLPDLGQSLWYLRWWPYALTHGLNPFITNKIWSAHGYNVMWEISIPALALLAWPVTATLGPIAAFNTIVILTFTLTAWMTFILCYHLTRQVWASLIGGYLFGFCGFMVSQGTGHLHLIVLFPLPLSIYLAALRYEGRISRARYLALAPLPLILLFLVSVEEFALVAVLAYLALGVWLLFHLSAWRETIRLALEATGAFLIATVLLSPFLYYMLAGYVGGVSHTNTIYSSDILGFFIPTDVFWVLSRYFLAVPMSGGNLSERDSYIGLPLTLLMLAFAYERWGKPSGKFLATMALISFVFALGPIIHVAGAETIRSPIRQVFNLPVIQKALPIRYALFLELSGAIMAAIWLAEQVRWRISKVALGLLLVVTLIPHLGAGLFATRVDVPPFFSTSLYQRYIKPGDNVLILPLGAFSREAMWQQQTNFAFTLSAGYGAVIPHPEDVLPIITRFGTAGESPAVRQPASAAEANAYQYYVEQYVATEHVTGIVVREGFTAQYSAYLAFLHEAPIHTGGVWYYPVSPEFSQATPPAEQVAGERVARCYQIGPVAHWDEQLQQIVAPAGAVGVAAQTWVDRFPGGTYDLALTASSASTRHFAHAEIDVMGQVTVIPLVNGVTRASFAVPGRSGMVVIRIVSDGGGAFSVGSSTLTKA
ncbi:MAG TPA: hypothetical protein VF808_07895 [Ktedonobacterales bacterium]